MMAAAARAASRALILAAVLVMCCVACGAGESAALAPGDNVAVTEAMCEFYSATVGKAWVNNTNVCARST